MSTENGRIRALVVDDYPDAAEALARLLQAIGCAATFVTESTKVMDAAEVMNAQIVFLDIGMPGIDGYELARMLRARYGEEVRLVAVTAYGDPGHRARSREAGFDAHVQKPADISLLRMMLATIMDHR